MIPDLRLEELARRYNNGAAVPDWADTLLPRWQRGSERVRADAAGARDVAYGQLPRNCFDVFAPKGAAPSTGWPDRKSTRLNSSHPRLSRMPSSA